MTRVQALQEIECLTAAYLTEDDPVRAVAEGCLQEVTDANARLAVLWVVGLKADKVVLVHLDFGGVFDQENSFIRGNEFPENIQEGCFPSSCASGDQDVFAPENIGLKLVRKPSLQGSGLDEIFDTEVPGIELADGQRDTIQTAGWNDGGNPASIRQARVEDRFGLRDIVTQAASDVFCGYHQRFFAYRETADLFNEASLLHKHTMRSIHHNLADRVVKDQVLDRLEKWQYRFESVH